MAAVVSAADAWYGQIRAREREGGREGGEEGVEMRESVGLGGIDGRGRRREERREERRSAGKADGEGREGYKASWRMESESDWRIKREKKSKKKKREREMMRIG